MSGGIGTVFPARGEPVTGREWPLQSYLELGALPTAVSCARLHARNVLWEWRMSALADTVELLVSELVSNAVVASGRASKGAVGGQDERQGAAGIPSVRFWLTSDRRTVLIQVWDTDQRMPVRQNPEPMAEGGRGLMLVDQLSTDWGSYVLAGLSGKIVWATAAAS